jgi:hypothetical protein
MSYPNPYVMAIRPDSSYSFSAVSNASYHQRATVSIGGQTAAVFSGQGEGVPMTLPGGQTVYSGATRQARQASVLFEYSTDGVNFEPSVVAMVTNTPTTVIVGTEDSNDGDDNDTVLTLQIT